MVILAVISWPASHIPESGILLLPYADKAIHFALFFVLAVLTALGFHVQQRPHSYNMFGAVMVLMSGILFGALTELMQHLFLPDRHGSLEDLVANIFGTIFGITFISIVLKHNFHGRP